MTNQQQNKIKKLVIEIRNTICSDGYKTGEVNEMAEEDVIGIMVSQYFQWSGISVLKVAESGLEDSNFHSECSVVRELLSKLEK